MTSTHQAFIAELFAGFGRVEVRRLFNFEGLFHQGTIFGVVAEERIYLKCDDNTRRKFVEEGASPFRFRRPDGEEIVTSYYEMPPRIYDEPEEAANWAQAAFEAAMKSPNTARKARREVKSKQQRQSPRPLLRK